MSDNASDNPYQAPASVPSRSLPDPWPRWLVRVLCALFLLFGFSSVIVATMTAGQSFIIIQWLCVIGGGGMSLLSAAAAIYGAVHNYRIGLMQIRLKRDLQNEVFDKPNV